MSSLCLRANMSIPWSMTSEMHDNHVTGLTGVMGAPMSRRDVVMLLQRAGLLPALKSSYKHNQFHFIISTRFNLLIWFASDYYLIFRREAFAFFNYWTDLPHFDNNLLLTRWTRLFRFPMVSSVPTSSSSWCSLQTQHYGCMELTTGTDNILFVRRTRPMDQELQ